MNLPTHSKSREKTIEKNIYLEHCFLLTPCTLYTLLCKCCVSEGKFQSGGSKVCLRIISDHFKAGPSSLFLYDSWPQLHFFLWAHYSSRCPIVPSLRAFSWAYQKHNTKICREEEENEEEVEGWPESKRRSPRETLASKEEKMLCFAVRAYLKWEKKEMLGSNSGELDPFWRWKQETTKCRSSCNKSSMLSL